MPQRERLIEILLRREETKDIEYKGPCSWNSRSNKASCCELVKDILSFANTQGGYLIIGVDEGTEGFIYTGLTEEQLSSFDTTKINQFVNNYTDPPINTTIYKLSYEEKNFVIISIPVFSDTPHICQKTYPEVLSEATLYVRTDNNESAPIKKSSDFRLVIENSIKNRADQLLTSFRSILKHGPETDETETAESKFNSYIDEFEQRSKELNPFTDKDYGYRVTAIFPSIFDAHCFEIDQLKEMIENGSINYIGWPFIYYNPHNNKQSYVVDDGIETCISEKHSTHGGDFFHYWRFSKTGLLYAAEILPEDSYLSVKGDTGRVLDFERMCFSAAQAIDCLTKLYSDYLSDEVSITLRFKITGLSERFIGSIFGRQRFFRGHHVSKIDETEYESIRSLAEWKAGIMDHALELCKHVFMRFNWTEPNLDACEEVINKMFKRRF